MSAALAGLPAPRMRAAMQPDLLLGRLCRGVFAISFTAGARPGPADKVDAGKADMAAGRDARHVDARSRLLTLGVAVSASGGGVCAHARGAPMTASPRRCRVRLIVTSARSSARRLTV